MSASDCVVMKEFFECFATGDIPGCMARMHDDCVLVEGEGLPHSGTFVGGEGFLQLVTKIGQIYSGAMLSEVVVYDAGEYVVARMIEDLGYAAVTAVDGQAGLDLLTGQLAGTD